MKVWKEGVGVVNWSYIDVFSVRETHFWNCLNFITIWYSFLWLKFPGKPLPHIPARSFHIITVRLDYFYLSILCNTQSITY